MPAGLVVVSVLPRLSEIMKLIVDTRTYKPLYLLFESQVRNLLIISYLHINEHKTSAQDVHYWRFT